MSSPLENIPCDVLQYISILASSSSPFDPPVEILCLMQTGPVIYEALNICSAPHIYAGIFSSKFDTAAPIRRHHITITDSALASELVNRCRLLQRSKRGDISSRNLINDLTTALWMYLESDGLNERQLLNVGFPDFILSVARTHLKGASSSHEIHHDIQPTLLGKLIIWLLCLALSRRFVFKIPEHGRKELYALIFPYILSSEKNTPSLHPYPKISCMNECRNLITPCRSMHPALDGGLDPSSAAGNLASVIFEFNPIKMPLHLREIRGIPVQDIEPTKSDFKTFANYETPLFADSLISDDSKAIDTCGTSRSSMHDLESLHFITRTSLDAHPKTRYILGSMTAVWEGVFRTIDAPAGSSAADNLSSLSVFIKPIQCSLNEYVNDNHTSTKRHMETLSWSHIFLNQDGSELYARGCKYRRHDTGPVSEALARDVVLHGETLENHDHAWGGYKFWGVVDEEGAVVLKRSAKQTNSFEGIWEFEGRLRFGSVLIGRWRMTGASDNVYHGIFSMTRM